MRYLPVFLLLLPAAAFAAEVHSLTLPQVVDLALRQNPDVVIARLDEQKAQLAVRVAKDPFSPKVYAGSGAAKIWGYPNSIDGSAPSILQVRTDMAVFNRPKSLELAGARESARGAALQTHSKMEEVAFRAATVFLDAAQAARSADIARHELDSLQRVKDFVTARISEGRELPIAGRRADVDLARTRQRLEILATDQAYAEGSLAMVLGFPPDDRVRALTDDDSVAASLEKALPASADAAVETALITSTELKSLKSQMEVKNLDARAERSARLPQVNLVAQYALFAQSAYQDYFSQRFQRNNGELGVSISVPVLVGTGAGARAAQAEIEVNRLRQQVNLQRNQISLETRRGYADVKNCADAHSLAKLDLDVAREQLSILLSQHEEGRVTAQQVEEARVTEQEKWLEYYASRDRLTRARLNLLRQMGTLLSALR
ncbi:MAG TPA: TolC family protein [Bryobacteraceae bacterium]|jgi:outer membrane protein TolC|nr:TolC family protein [Bryobacteraceae bacterium]